MLVLKKFIHAFALEYMFGDYELFIYWFYITCVSLTFELFNDPFKISVHFNKKFFDGEKHFFNLDN